MDSEKDLKNTSSNDKPWLWKKGKSMNPGGRPKGAVSLKTYVRNYLLALPDEEKDEYLDSLPKDLIWRMAEGNPETKTDVKVNKDITFTEEELLEAQKIIEKRIRDTTTQPGVRETIE